MLSKGAVMIVTDHDIKCGKQLVTDNTRLCLARLLNSFYGKPSEKLGLLAVTVFPVIAVIGVNALCSKNRD